MQTRLKYKHLQDPKNLFWYAIITLSLPNIALCLTEGMPPAACAANITLPVAAYWLLMSAGRNVGKTIWLLFVIVFFAAFQLVLLYLFGHSIIAVDMFLNLVTTNAGEVAELLNNLVPAVAGVFVIYLPLLIFAAIAGIKKQCVGSDFLKRQRRLAAIPLAAGACCLGASYITDKDYSARTDLYPLNVFYNLYLAAERTYATAHYSETSADFSFGATPTHGAGTPEVYVMVVGETGRAANFGMYGYKRNTTPLLAQTEGVTAFTHALTQSNTTHKSVPMLISAASAEDYNRIYNEKSIITAFKEAGFHTAFLSNQLPNRSFIDIFGEEADECLFIKENAGADANPSDMLLADETEKILAKRHDKLFVVLHTYGSHFNYRERYPAEMAFYKPDNASEAVAGNRESLQNAYDNTIRFTDRFLHSVITKIKKYYSTGGLLYVSDHGENIFDDSRNLFLHASPIPSCYELHVPMVVWLSEQYRAAYPEKAESLRANRDKRIATSASVFHTMLDAAGISTAMLADSLSAASRNFKETDYHYLNDHNKPITAGKIGLKDADRKMLGAWGFDIME